MLTARTLSHLQQAGNVLLESKPLFSLTHTASICVQCLMRLCGGSTQACQASAWSGHKKECGRLRKVQKARTLVGLTVEERLRRATRLRTKKRFTQSADELRVALGLTVRGTSEHAEVMLQLGISLNGQGLREHAERHYESMLKQYPDHDAGFYNLGVVRSDMGNIDGAIAALDRAIEINPDCHAALSNRATLLAAKDDRAGSEAGARAAAKARATPGSLFNLGSTLLECGKLAEAADAFRRSLQLDPERVDSVGNLAITLRAMGDLKGSLECYRRCIELGGSENSHRCYYNYANALYQQHREGGGDQCLRDAIEAYREAMKNASQSTPDGRRGWLGAAGNLGGILSKRNRGGDAEECTALAERAHELQPENANFCYMLGVALVRRGRTAPGVKMLQLALTLKPEECHQGARDVLRQLGVEH